MKNIPPEFPICHVPMRPERGRRAIREVTGLLVADPGARWRCPRCGQVHVLLWDGG